MHTLNNIVIGQLFFCQYRHDSMNCFKYGRVNHSEQPQTCQQYNTDRKRSLINVEHGSLISSHFLIPLCQFLVTSWFFFEILKTGRNEGRHI